MENRAPVRCDGRVSDGGLRLIGTRLMLRDFVAADEVAVHSYACDPSVTRFMDWGPNSIDDTRAFLREAEQQAQKSPRRSFDFAVIDTESHALIGGAALTLTDAQHHRGELGYVIHPDFWSKGLATEATHDLLRFGFDHLHLRRISATCHPENHASSKVLQKAGFSYEGRMRDHLVVHGAWRDSLLYAAVAGDATTATGPPAPTLDQPRLEAEGIALRAFTDADAAVVVEAGRDPLIPLITSVRAGGDLVDALEYIRNQHVRAATGTGWSYAIVDTATDRAVGQIGLWRRDIEHGRASVGYWVGPSHRRRGYAARALTALSNWAATVPEITRLELYVEPSNEPSWRTAESAGYRREGLLQRWQVVANQARDMYMYAKIP